MLLTVEFVKEDDPSSKLIVSRSLACLVYPTSFFLGIFTTSGLNKTSSKTSKKGDVCGAAHFYCCSALHSCKGLEGCEFCFCIDVWFFRVQALTLIFE